MSRNRKVSGKLFFYKFTVPLSPGTHVVTAVDSEGHTLSVRVEAE